MEDKGLKCCLVNCLPSWFLKVFVFVIVKCKKLIQKQLIKLLRFGSKIRFSFPNNN